MTCRHSPGDPSCGSHPMNRSWGEGVSELRSRLSRASPDTPDPSAYEVLEAEQVGANLVLKLRYPSCSSCSFEGEKVMVFLGASLRDAIRWRRVDPHFRERTGAPAPGEAPGPDARFPASPRGWSDALCYARGASP